MSGYLIFFGSFFCCLLRMFELHLEHKTAIITWYHIHSCCFSVVYEWYIAGKVKKMKINVHELCDKLLFILMAFRLRQNKFLGIFVWPFYFCDWLHLLLCSLLQLFSSSYPLRQDLRSISIFCLINVKLMSFRLIKSYLAMWQSSTKLTGDSSDQTEVHEQKKIFHLSMWRKIAWWRKIEIDGQKPLSCKLIRLSFLFFLLASRSLSNLHLHSVVSCRSLVMVMENIDRWCKSN